MGLFGRLLKKRDMYETAICDIACAVSFGDKAVKHRINSCVSDIKRYVKHYDEKYKSRGIAAENADDHTLIWIGLVDCLIDLGYAQELDWKCGKEDFIEHISSLKGFSILDCKIEPSKLYDDDDVAGLCAAQDAAWSADNVCVGGIDIDSDSYVLFVCRTETLAALKNMADSIHCRVDRGSEL